MAAAALPRGPSPRTAVRSAAHAAARVVRTQLIGGRASQSRKAGPETPVRHGAPEIYFSKPIDNSRLVKVADRARNREMAHFTMAVCGLFLLVMVYAWQHFAAIEYGYQIEALKAQRDSYVELHRALSLEEASLRSPERIDILARRLGLDSPQVGQLIRLDSSGGDASPPVLASATSVSVVSPQR
ncbi:MAG: cell division protein FtsL [Acidobacteria bacterium]|nr:cell division protein FtsL [Acidobacteriota bacterium]